LQIPVGRNEWLALAGWHATRPDDKDSCCRRTCVVSHRGLAAARVIARHLSAAHIDDSGNTVVPLVPDIVLRKYYDELVFEYSLAGSHSGDAWTVNGSEQLRREAQNSQRFPNHTYPRIRPRSKSGIANRIYMAEWEKRQYAERFLPS